MVHKVFSFNFINLFRIFLIGLVVLFFHLLAPQSHAFQPTVGSWTYLGFSGCTTWEPSVDPNNANIVYIPSCQGIQKSVDGGTTWSVLSSTHGGYGPIVVDPTNSSVLYSGEGNGVWKSTDGGVNWTNTTAYLTLSCPGFNVSYLVMDPNNHNVLYSGNYQCGGVWKTTDGGTTWTDTSLGNDIARILVDPTNSNIVYASIAETNLYKSTDGGTTWTGYNTGKNNVRGIAIDPNNHNVLYVGSDNGVSKSTDGGVNWTFFSNGPQGNITSALITDPSVFNTVYAGGIIGDNNGVLESSDGGSSWGQINNGLAIPSVIMKYLLIPVNYPNVMYASTTNGMYVYGLRASNQPPTVNALSNATINEGDTYTASGSFSDPDSTSWTATVDYGDGTGRHALTLSGMNFALIHTYTTAGTYTTTVRVTDNQGATGLQTTTVTVNAPPVINSFSGGTINEGDTYTSNGSFTDSDSTSWTATVDYGDGGGAHSLTLSGTNFSLSHLYKDNGTYTVTVSVTDNQGATGTGTATITVNNVVPTVGTITAPSSPVLVNTAITASANFTDPGVLDTHNNTGTYWNWGDGSSTTTGTVTESNGSGSVSNNHTYTATGVYTITLTVTDKDGGVGTSTPFQYVAVYDSSTSFAGGRSFDNPSSASPNTTGKVSFGISSKYNNSNVLTGSVKMNFKAANIDFASISLSSLATSNGKAYLKGSGTVNGSGSYMFLASGIDGSVVGGNDLIRFQIKDSSNNIVYDSQPGAGDTTDPTTSDATGNIRVH